MCIVRPKLDERIENRAGRAAAAAYVRDDEHVDELAFSSEERIFVSIEPAIARDDDDESLRRPSPDHFGEFEGFARSVEAGVNDSQVFVCEDFFRDALIDEGLCSLSTYFVNLV